MKKTYRGILCLFFAVLLIVSLYGCSVSANTDTPHTDDKQESDKEKRAPEKSEEPINKEEPPKKPLDASSFTLERLSTHEKLSVPEELTGGDTRLLYQDKTRMIYEKSLRIDESENNWRYEPESLVLYSLTDGTMLTYPIETENYVISALPYESGILYVIYEYHSIEEFSLIVWKLLFTDGKSTEQLYGGIVHNLSIAPQLMYVQDTPYFHFVFENGYTVYKVDGKKISKVFVDNSNVIGNLVNLTASNGEQFYYVTKHRSDKYYSLCVVDSNGIKYRHKLMGEVMGCAITDRYAVCAVFDEEPNDFFLEAIDLATGEVTVFPFSHKQSSQKFTGIGSVLFTYDEVNYDVMAIDIEGQRTFIIPNPLESKVNCGLRFDGVCEDGIFLSFNGGKEFYKLNVTG